MYKSNKGSQLSPPAPKGSSQSYSSESCTSWGTLPIPFTLQMAVNLPCSMRVQPGPGDTEKACGIDFELKSVCAENLEGKIPKRFTTMANPSLSSLLSTTEPTRSSKKIKISGGPITDVVLYSLDKYTKTVLAQEFT
ncbi:hypothetical protein MC885_017441 [Smutsia gigantea]|nr:hypothetical protein MC885_017441 [Smutsia gigantea]